jgi:hypothetical protein
MLESFTADDEPLSAPVVVVLQVHAQSKDLVEVPILIYAIKSDNRKSLRRPTIQSTMVLYLSVSLDINRIPMTNIPRV